MISQNTVRAIRCLFGRHLLLDVNSNKPIHLVLRDMTYIDLFSAYGSYWPDLWGTVFLKSCLPCSPCSEVTPHAEALTPFEFLYGLIQQSIKIANRCSLYYDIYVDTGQMYMELLLLISQPFPVVLC